MHTRTFLVRVLPYFLWKRALVSICVTDYWKICLRGVFPRVDGINQLAQREGLRGLSKGMLLALFGVSNGAIQFMTYEELKKWRVEARRARLGPGVDEDKIKALVCVCQLWVFGRTRS